MSIAVKEKKVLRKRAKPAEHPKYTEMVKAAVNALNERNGSSRQAIDKYIRANYKVGDNCGSHIKLALKRMSENKELIHTKGVGASGSFKLNKAIKEEKPKKKPDKKPAAKNTVVKKPAAKKVKKSPKKATKSPKNTKSPKQTKSPKKDKKPAATDKPKKAANKPAAKPKPPAKKPVTKKAVKEPAVKKTAKSPKKK